MALVGGVAGFCLVFLFQPSGDLSRSVAPLVSSWAAPPCMAIVGSHLWFGRCFGSPLCCDAFGVGNFVLDPYFGASTPPSMLEVDRVVLLDFGFLFVLPWWGRRGSRGVSS